MHLFTYLSLCAQKDTWGYNLTKLIIPRFLHLESNLKHSQRQNWIPFLADKLVDSNWWRTQYKKISTDLNYFFSSGSKYQRSKRWLSLCFPLFLTILLVSKFLVLVLTCLLLVSVCAMICIFKDFPVTALHAETIFVTMMTTKILRSKLLLHRQPVFAA